VDLLLPVRASEDGRLAFDGSEQGEDMELRPARIEDVPVPELSGLALVAGSGSPVLLAIGDRKSVLLRAALTDERLEWSSLDLGADGGQGGQFEGVAVTGDGKVLVLREYPPAVSVVGPSGALADTITFEPGAGKHLDDIFDDATSSGEGLVPLQEGRLLVAQEKRPPLLVEFGLRGAEPAGISAGSFARPDSLWDCRSDRLQALAAWRLHGLEDISALAVADGVLYCLSDQSRRVVAVELPLDPGSRRAEVADRWDLKVPERSGEPEGKPEGLVVNAEGTFIVGLDTRAPEANLCWYPR
jgi:uncharacterized protein YjiK